MRLNEEQADSVPPVAKLSGLRIRSSDFVDDSASYMSF